MAIVNDKITELEMKRAELARQQAELEREIEQAKKVEKAEVVAKIYPTVESVKPLLADDKFIKLLCETYGVVPENANLVTQVFGKRLAELSREAEAAKLKESDKKGKEEVEKLYRNRKQKAEKDFLFVNKTREPDAPQSLRSNWSKCSSDYEGIVKNNELVALQVYSDKPAFHKYSLYQHLVRKQKVMLAPNEGSTKRVRSSLNEINKTVIKVTADDGRVTFMYCGRSMRSGDIIRTDERGQSTNFNFVCNMFNKVQYFTALCEALKFMGYATELNQIINNAYRCWNLDKTNEDALACIRFLELYNHKGNVTWKFVTAVNGENAIFQSNYRCTWKSEDNNVELRSADIDTWFESIVETIATMKCKTKTEIKNFVNNIYKNIIIYSGYSETQMGSYEIGSSHVVNAVD